MNARNSFRPLTLASVIAAVFAATTLAACDRGQQQDRPAGQKPDSTMSRAQQKMDSAKNEMSQGAAEAKRDMKDAATDAKNVVNDATITASVNAKLASDKELSALRINVDTVDGRVALRGTAPTPAARDKATQIASTVDGVRSVENQLVVSSKS
ncbi:MAG TPA: BON domain-containing protein [Burkholderiaceae bacterium]|jgi:osmotically-inducible protein OsmY|nr:BON domain-containing protein [Burkholderiaceae bacterium]